MRIAFLHPDLGIGGAERLIVDAAVVLQRDHGHDVRIFTSHHDVAHCFAETRDGTLAVYAHGDFLPAHVFGRFRILCAILRSIYLALIVVFYKTPSTSPSPEERDTNNFKGEAATKKDDDDVFDVYIVDQLSTYIPILRLRAPRARILFYCHFPDLLLSTRASLLKRIYRYPFDAIEEWTTGMADEIVVNSFFTADIFVRTFAALVVARHKKDGAPSSTSSSTTTTSTKTSTAAASLSFPSVLHPCINFASYDGTSGDSDDVAAADAEWLSGWPRDDAGDDNDNDNDGGVGDGDGNVESEASTSVFLSINRFEEKKNVALAVRALALLNGLLRTSEKERNGTTVGRDDEAENGKDQKGNDKNGKGENGKGKIGKGEKKKVKRAKKAKLVVAGGFDTAQRANVTNYNSLCALVDELGLHRSEYPCMQGDVVFLRSFSLPQRTVLLQRCVAVVYTPSNEHFGIVPVEAM
jgi:alpha-1,3/alpha-1,6-mannosyltransferase